MDEEKRLAAWDIIARTAAVHTITYILVGAIAASVFNYATTIPASGLGSYMRSMDDPMVRAGLLFQPIRGVLFGFVFYLLRDVFFRRKNGWLIIWATLVVLGILSTFAPASGSIEGFIYLKVSLADRWGGMVEILTQSFLLSVLTYYWVNHGDKKWLNWMLGILFGVAVLLGVASAFLVRAGG